MKRKVVIRLNHNRYIKNNNDNEQVMSIIIIRMMMKIIMMKKVNINGNRSNLGEG